ncbi:MAG: hypothetical protein HN919_19450 [Verrucomicrobia bacterium]|nr:hypothetical protein [Verrucomicrobiota bacterium]MBT7068479.1 hypothetical protein [Verrucomicrobiota bacterium]MBT7701132.1 hypothetical protein [Verrucomicrobiota bacterium]
MKIDIVGCGRVTADERVAMYAVFARYYENLDRARFDQDLDTKDWVIQLRDNDGSIVGFSTVEQYRHDGAAGAAVILYSGDTIVDRAHRKCGDLAGAFGHLLLRAVAESGDLPVYWLLTSKGVRTYRFLPVFFKTFFPRHDQDPPVAFKRLLDEVATRKFGRNYSPATQVIHQCGQRDWLCAEEHDPLLLKRSDAHIRFFLQQNPGYIKGDELACMAQMSEENLNTRALRVIRNREVTWRE